MSEKEVLSVNVPQEVKQHISSVAEENSESQSKVAAEYLVAGIREEETRLSALAGRLKDAGEKAAGFAVLVSVVMYVLGHGMRSSMVMFLSFAVLSLVLLLLGELFGNVSSEENGVVSGVDRGQMSDDFIIIPIGITVIIGILLHSVLGPNRMIWGLTAVLTAVLIVMLLGFIVIEVSKRLGVSNGE